MEFQNNNHKIDNMLDLDINKDILNLRDEKSTRNNLININKKHGKWEKQALEFYFGKNGKITNEVR